MRRRTRLGIPSSDAPHRRYLARADRELAERVRRVHLDDAEAILEAKNGGGLRASTSMVCSTPRSIDALKSCRSRPQLDHQHAQARVDRLRLVVRSVGGPSARGIKSAGRNEKIKAREPVPMPEPRTQEAYAYTDGASTGSRGLGGYRGRHYVGREDRGNQRRCSNAVVRSDVIIQTVPNAFGGGVRDVDALHSLSRGRMRGEPAQGFILDIRRVSFVEPHGLVALLLTARRLAALCSRRVELVNMGSQVYSYLERMDLFEWAATGSRRRRAWKRGGIGTPRRPTCSNSPPSRGRKTWLR